MTHHDYKDLLPARALDALDESDARLADEHLETCAECQAEFLEWRDTASLLANTATPSAPSAEVRARIIAAVAGEKANTAKAATRSAKVGQVLALPPRPARTLWPTLLKLAAGIAFLGLIIGLLLLWRREVVSQREIARLVQEADNQQRELGRIGEVLVREREAIALLTAPDTKKAQLTGSQVAQTARATFAFDRTGRAVLFTEGLPEAPAGKAYELWFIANGHPLPGKVFTVDRSGRATVADEVPAEAREKAVFAVTLEPGKGSSAPTGAIYLSSPAS